MSKMQQRFFLLTTFLVLALLCPAAALNRYSGSQPVDQEALLIPLTGAQTLAGCGGEPVEVVNADFEQQVVELTNQVRAEQGLPPLKRVNGLNQSARYHAADMNFDDYFSHNTHDRQEGGLSEVCDTWQRISQFYTNWQALAENIAAGQRDPQQAMEGWINSPDHYHNIMSDSYWEIGTGYFQGNGTYHDYWVQNFGKTSNRFPLILNDEAAYTASQEVEVYIYGEWHEMRLRVNEHSWTHWRPFETRFTWRLPSTPGAYVLTAELRSAENSTITSDSIVLTNVKSSETGAWLNASWLKR